MRSYGRKLFDILTSANTPSDLGEDFGHGLFEAEVDYLIRSEWARCPDDILWRRSKLGIRFTDTQKARLQAFMDSNKHLQTLAAE